MKRFAWCIALAVAFVVIRAVLLQAAGATPAEDAPASMTKSAAPDDVAGGSDWPQWRGPNRNGLSPENINWPVGGPKQLWKAAVGEGYSSVSIGKGRAYTMGNTDGVDTVWCLDARTGAEVWKYSYPCKRGTKDYPGPRATPTVDGKFVYTVSYFGQLLALNAETGAVVWSVDYIKDFGSKIGNSNRHGYSCSPLVAGNLLLVNVGARGASVVAFDKTTGEVVWKSGDDPPSFSSPVAFTLGAQRIVAMFSGTGLYGYSLADGTLLWSIQSKNGNDLNAPDPVPMGDKVFITSGMGGGCSLVKITDGSAKEVYRNKNLESHCATPVLIGGFLYGFTGRVNNPKMICLDPNTGQIKWQNPKVGGSLIAAGKKLIIQSLDGSLIVAEASPDGYREIGRAPALTEVVSWKGQCWTPPSLANGRVYCRNNAGEVVCLDLSGK